MTMFWAKTMKRKFICHYFLTILTANKKLTGFHCILIANEHILHNTWWWLIAVVKIYGVIGNIRPGYLKTEMWVFSHHFVHNSQYMITGLETKKILKSPFGDQLEKNSRQMQSFSRQFVNDAVRASNISRGSQSREIHKNTQNTAKFGRNLIKYMSVQHVWNVCQLLGLFTLRKLVNLSWNFVTETCKQRPVTPKLPGVDYVAKNWALAMMLKALPLVHFWSILLLKEQMMTSVRKT